MRRNGRALQDQDPLLLAARQFAEPAARLLPHPYPDERLGGERPIGGLRAMQEPQLPIAPHQHDLGYREGETCGQSDALGHIADGMGPVPRGTPGHLDDAASGS